MRQVIATLAVALLILTVATPVVQAAPTQVHVRIEGRTETLFEGPILTEGHNVRAAESDAGAPQGGRPCDGTNNGQHSTPGLTPTAASVDAMSILGEDFDGKWYEAPLEDYFIKRWGPDAQDDVKGKYWGVIVNNVFTSVGGCQYQLDGGDEVLWVYDAFDGKPRLALYPADYTGGPQVPTATAELGEPFEVEVDTWEGYNEGVPPDSPQRTGADPYEGAEVAPVQMSSEGFQRVETESAETVVTDSDGLASIVFGEPGWHRIKATVSDGTGGEGAVRSNRLDVCVPPAGAGDCGALPADAQVRVPPPTGEDPDPEDPPGTGPPSPGAADPSDATPPQVGQVHLELPRLDRSRIARGLIRLKWRVPDAGVGISGWRVSSRALGRRGSRFVTRARGTSETSALLRLPAGIAHLLRLTVTDALGRSSTATIGKVWVPPRDT